MLTYAERDNIPAHELLLFALAVGVALAVTWSDVEDASHGARPHIRGEISLNSPEVRQDMSRRRLSSQRFESFR